MENYYNLKIGLFSATIVLSITTAIYLISRFKRRYRDAVEAFHYLDIKIVTSESACDELVTEIARRSKLHRAIGFDCEWVTEHGKRQPVALIQLSTHDGLCGLFRMNQLKTVPQSLKNLLEDERIYKVGVAPVDDAKYLYHDYFIALKSTLDLRHLAHLSGHKPGGLAALSKSLLHVVLDKSWRIRCSNWQADVLSDRQVRYAAADAHVAIKMFVKLIDGLRRKDLCPAIVRDDRNDNVWSDLDSICWKYADVCYRTNNNVKQKRDWTIKETKNNKESGISNKKYPHATRSKPLYHNCFLEAPDGELLCTCDNKKAVWYVQKKLADVVKEEPLTVRLRFEPAGRSVGDVGLYYRLTKENKCVVCGATNSYIRKNVVPREYRKYFPEIMKDHSSHDIVLLCVDCHQRSNIDDQAIRDRLAAQCNAPLPYSEHAKYMEDANSKAIRSAARALLYQVRKHELPAARRRELEQVLLRHFPGRREFTEDMLKEAARLQVVYENTNYESHGFKVTEYFLKREGGLLRLEELWRQHFLDSMRPRYMPELWSVKHNEERLRVKLNEGRLSQKDLKLIGVKSL